MRNSPTGSRPSHTPRFIGAVVALAALLAVGTIAATGASVIVPATRTADGAVPTRARVATDTDAAPTVGATAPDFTGSLVRADGRANAVRLSTLRSRVVVLAFFPKDRTQGCTAELTKFRDEFATLFGEGVTVLPVSLDDVPTHASWSAEMHFPFGLVSDTSGEIARLYGSIDAGQSYANRTVFVIGKDGRVTWRELRFRALDEHAYQRLAEAVAAAKQS